MSMIRSFFLIDAFQLVIRGSRKKLNRDDMIEHPDRCHSSECHERFDEQWAGALQAALDKHPWGPSSTETSNTGARQLDARSSFASHDETELALLEATGSTVSLSKVIVKQHFWWWLLSFFLCLTFQATSLIGAVLMKPLLELAKDASAPIERGILFIGLMIVCMSIGIFALAHSIVIMVKIGLAVRNSIVSAIFRKALRLRSGLIQTERKDKSREEIDNDEAKAKEEEEENAREAKAAKKEGKQGKSAKTDRGIAAEEEDARAQAEKKNDMRGTGQILTLMSNDTQRILETTWFLNFGLTAPFLLIACITLLWLELGAYTLVGLLVMLLMIPLNGYMANLFAKYRRETLVFTDRRAKLENELLQGIQVVKFYGWEDSFVEKALAVRREELRLVLRLGVARAFFQFMLGVAPSLVALVTFAAYSQSSNAFTPGIIFTSIALLNVMRMPLLVIPFVMSILVQNAVSMKRARDFLLLPEIAEESELYKRTASTRGKHAITVHGVSFSWMRRGTDAITDADDASAETTAVAPREVQTEKNSKPKSEVDTNSAVVVSSAASLTKEDNEFGFTMPNVNLDIERGKLTVIVGEVAAGKSSLLHALLNEMTILPADENRTRAAAPASKKSRRKKGKKGGANSHDEDGDNNNNNNNSGNNEEVSRGVFFAGSCAFVPQQAWITNGTLRDNIISGRDFDEDEYADALHAACLVEDIRQFVGGDLTEIGERGVNLSGGQKQRVSIARAVYSDADVVLMDDPFSALDAHCSRDLFQRCILGKLKHKTRVIVTNQLQFVPHADKVVLLKDGLIAEQGTFASLAQAGQGLQRLMEEFGVEVQGGEEPRGVSDKQLPQESPGKSGRRLRSRRGGKGISATILSDEQQQEEGGNNTRDEQDRQERARESKAMARDIARGSDDALLGEDTTKEQRAAGAALMTNEKQKTGNVGLSVYWFMMKVGGVGLFFICVGFAVLQASAKAGSDFWLSLWTAFESGEDKVWESATRDTYLGLYFAWAGTEMVASVLMAVFFLVFMMRVSRKLHSSMLTRLGRTPLSFFDQTPVGRILNRLGADLDLIDFKLPMSLQQYMVSTMMLVSIFVVVSFMSPWVLVGSVPVLVLYYVFERFYRLSSIEIERCVNTSRSPVFAHFVEALHGVVSIRAYGIQNQFIQQNAKFLDVNSSAFFTAKYAHTWFQFALGFMGIFVMVVVVIVVVVLRGSVSPSLVGLAFAYASNLLQTLRMYSRQSAESEAHMNGVERFQEYMTETPQERPHVLPGEETADKASRTGASSSRRQDAWPTKGVVEFRNVTVRYRAELPAVLRHVSFKTRSSEKIGIVGKSGSGKSTILNALLRMIEIDREEVRQLRRDRLQYVKSLRSTYQSAEGGSKQKGAKEDNHAADDEGRGIFENDDDGSNGSIWIDGVDTFTVGLKKLRKAIGIIPQDPLLFSGSVRYNLDPFNDFDDQQIWSALELAQMKHVIARLPDKLNEEVREGGTNFSVGERQLLCVARALVKQPKVLLMDEATASVDMETDQTIQRMVRQHFTQSTIITIAHRLDTVIDYDRLLVLGKGGYVAQFGSPAKLLKDETLSAKGTNLFANLVADTGKASSRRLKAIAFQGESQPEPQQTASAPDSMNTKKKKKKKKKAI